MTQPTSAQKSLAIEAERLRTDRPFAEAVRALRKDAVEKLIIVDPTDQAAVMNLQAYVRAIDALCGEIAAQILRGTPQKGPPVA